MSLERQKEDLKELEELEARINEANAAPAAEKGAEAEGPESPSAGELESRGDAAPEGGEEGTKEEEADPAGRRAPLLAGRFKDSGELEKAYRHLEAAYTRKGQLLSLLDGAVAPPAARGEAPKREGGDGAAPDPGLPGLVERAVSESLRPYAGALAVQSLETAFRTLNEGRQTRLLNTLKQFPVLRSALQGLVGRATLADVPSVENAAWQLIELADGYMPASEAAALRDAGRDEAAKTLRMAERAFTERAGAKGTKGKAIDVNDRSTFEHLSLEELEGLIAGQAARKA